VIKGSRVIAVLAGLAGIALILAAGFQIWAYVSIGNLPGVSDTPLNGRRAVPSAVPIALAAGAGVIVLVTSGRVIRYLVAGALLLAGAAVALNSLNARQNAIDTAGRALETISGLFGQSSLIAPAGLLAGATARLTVWSWVSLAGGLLVALSGLIGLLAGGHWPGPAARFETTGGHRGGADASAGSGAAAHVRADPGTVDEVSAWDALTRGEDPT
jgi:Tryptophan-associated transmembrane protein (Trp_oprn_chp)